MTPKQLTYAIATFVLGTAAAAAWTTWALLHFRAL